jgi:hypothetical protein
MDHQEKPWEKTKAFVHTYRGWKHQIFPTFSVEFNPSKRFSSPPTAVDCTTRDSLTDVDSPSTNTITCKGSTFFVPLLRESLYLHVIRMGQASSAFSQAALLKHRMCKGRARSRLSGQLKRGNHAYSLSPGLAAGISGSRTDHSVSWRSGWCQDTFSKVASNLTCIWGSQKPQCATDLFYTHPILARYR